MAANVSPAASQLKRRMLPKRPPTMAKTMGANAAAPRRTLGNLQSTTGSRNGASFFKPNTNKNAHTVTMQVIGLTDLHTRKSLESALLKLNGIVSFTIDMGKVWQPLPTSTYCFATAPTPRRLPPPTVYFDSSWLKYPVARAARHVYLHLSPNPQARVAIRALSTLSVEMITIGIQQTKIMSAQQIIKNEDGAEVVLSFGTAPAGVGASAPAANMPRYLDDEEENAEPDNPKTALQITNGITTGFTGFLSSAVSSFSSTFHW